MVLRPDQIHDNIAILDCLSDGLLIVESEWEEQNLAEVADNFQLLHPVRITSVRDNNLIALKS